MLGFRHFTVCTVNVRKRNVRFKKPNQKTFRLTNWTQKRSVCSIVQLYTEYPKSEQIRAFGLLSWSTKRLKSELFSSDFGHLPKLKPFGNQTISKNAEHWDFRHLLYVIVSVVHFVQLCDPAIFFLSSVTCITYMLRPTRVYISLFTWTYLVIDLPKSIALFNFAFFLCRVTVFWRQRVRSWSPMLCSPAMSTWRSCTSTPTRSDLRADSPSSPPWPTRPIWRL